VRSAARRSDPPISAPPSLAHILAMAGGAPPESFFQRLHDALRDSFGAAAMTIAQLESSGKGFRTRYSRDRFGSDIDAIVEPPAALASSALGVMPLSSNAAIVTAPLRAGGRCIGYLAVASAAADGFDPAAIEWIERAADVVALVVSAAAFADEASARSDDIRLLLKTARALASERDIEHLFERFFDLVRPIMDAGSFYVALGSWDDGQMTIPFAMDDGARVHLGGKLPIEGSLTGHVFREGIPLIMRTLSDFDAYSSIVRGEGEETQSALIVPMRIEDRTIGVISVQSVSPNAYSERERDLLVAIAEQAAIAVENSQHLNSSALASSSCSPRSRARCPRSYRCASCARPSAARRGA
jgi:GAF domain-containing protein